jgi:hypothetical protein
VQQAQEVKVKQKKVVKSRRRLMADGGCCNKQRQHCQEVLVAGEKGVRDAKAEEEDRHHKKKPVEG